MTIETKIEIIEHELNRLHVKEHEAQTLKELVRLSEQIERLKLKLLNIKLEGFKNDKL